MFLERFCIQEWKTYHIRNLKYYVLQCFVNENSILIIKLIQYICAFKIKFKIILESFQMNNVYSKVSEK